MVEKIGDNRVLATEPKKYIAGTDIELLGDEEQDMQRLLIEKYRKDGKILLDEVKKWRESNPDKSYINAIRALYKIEEDI